MKRIIILLASILFLSSCSLKLNKTTMKEYFSHIRKSGRYEVVEVIGNKAILKHFKDTINIYNVKVKAGDFIQITVLK